MTQSDKESVCSTSLEELISQALQQIEQLNYSRRSIRRYRLVWEQILKHSYKTGQGNTLSENLAASFIKDNQLGEIFTGSLV